MTRQKYTISKRLFDLVLAASGLLLFLPVGVVAILLIYWEDRGPIFFTQERIGRGRRAFKVYKFRTMRDQQVTRAGKWLRETGLDEIAQILNVLRGDMSIVGPRPLTDRDIERLGWDTEAHDLRWQIRPGITGMAQLFGRGSAASSYCLDRYYIKHRSVMLDVYVIVLSVAVNLFGKKRVRRWLYGRRRRPADAQ